MQKYERHGASRKYLVYLITRRGEKKLGVKKKRTKFKITYIFENFGEKISCTLKYIYIEWQRILETEFREIPDEYSRILSDM